MEKIYLQSSPQEEMIPSTSSTTIPALHRKHNAKEHGIKHNINKDSEEVKVHASRIRRTSKRTRLALQFLIVVAVFIWIGTQLCLTGSLSPDKSMFIPLINQNSKESSFKILEILNNLISSILLRLPFGSNEETIQSATKQQQIEDDYIFIFYVLLGINVLVVLPFLYQQYIHGSKSNNSTSSIPNGLELTSIHENHQQYQIQQREKHNRSIHHKLFYQTYLPPYLLATSADWLQGPYKYALYSSYGYTQRDIAHLFVVGYGSGMVLGSIVGGLADGYGRKRLCLCYCIAYAVSVTCTHCKDYYVLLLGRCGGGVGTSLLFSVFESWLIGAHVDRGLVGKKVEGGEKWLAESFAVGTYGSSFVAIISGVMANFIVARSGKMRMLHFGEENGDNSIYYGGYIAAFDACWPILICCAALIISLWEENYGEEHSLEDKDKPTRHHSNGAAPNKNELDCINLKKHSNDGTLILQKAESQSNVHLEIINTTYEHHKEGMIGTLWNGMVTVWRSPQILMCCIIGSCFEGAMYIFIFLWTPALTSIQRSIQFGGNNENTEDLKQLNENSHGDIDELPFGWIFSSFMVCCMLGTITFTRVTNYGVSASKSLIWILALSALSCLAMAIPFTVQSNTNSGAQTVQYLGMLLYEFCIGAYYPAMGTVKGTIVPEDQRAAIYNVFRLPLNLMVLLYLVGDFNTETSFLANAIMLFAACGLQIRIVKDTSHQHCK